MGNVNYLVIYLILFLSSKSVFCDGDHAHAHGEAVGTTATSKDGADGPTGTVTSVHTTSGNPDAFSSIIAGLDPQLLSSLARNPQIAGALKGAGVDVGTVTAAKAAAEAGGSVQPPNAGGYDYPPPPRRPGPPLGGGGFPFPFFGPYKNFHVSGDIGFGYPIVEKVIVIVGGGILLLVILALLTKGFAKGGLFYDWGSSLSEALAGSASVDIGPFHKSVAGAGAINAGVGNQRPHNQFNPTPANMQMTQRVYDGIDQKF